jgi:hypothetical protein
LSAEFTYVIKSLLGGVIRYISKGQFGRAGAVVTGLGITTLSYLFVKVSNRSAITVPAKVSP